MDRIETTPVGSRRHSHVGTKGDLRVELHYASIAGGERQACLYIYQFSRPKDGVLMPFADMWRVVENGAIDTLVHPIAKKLYGFVTQADTHRVMDVLFDYLQDLKDHPPEPDMAAGLDDFLADCDEHVGEFFLEINGKRVI